MGTDIGEIWKELGRRLDVTYAMQNEIDKAHQLLSEKAYYTLKHWKQSKGAAASYQALCDALQDRCVQRQDLVEIYCYIKGNYLPLWFECVVVQDSSGLDQAVWVGAEAWVIMFHSQAT